MIVQRSVSAVLEADGLPLGPRLLADSSLTRQTSRERGRSTLGEGSATAHSTFFEPRGLSLELAVTLPHLWRWRRSPGR